MVKNNYLERITRWEKRHSLFDDIKGKLPKKIINVKIESEDKLFDSFDASETSQKELCQELDSFLMNKVDAFDFLPNLTVNIKLNFTPEFNVAVLTQCFSNYFERKAIETFKQNRAERRKWFWKLIAGVIFFGFCLLMSQIFNMSYFEAKPAFKVLGESLSIVGWVAIWEPAGFFLFRRKENQRILRNYMILHKSEFIVE